jgi:ABC-type phosphate transport system permease subunit
MSALDQSSRRRPQRRSRRAVIGRVALAVAGVALAFLLGIAFARTLDERPESGGEETIVRTLEPILQGAPTRTVTVTVTTTP